VCYFLTKGKTVEKLLEEIAKLKAERPEDDLGNSNSVI